jgi:uncharacterized membrane protein YphA (DoxX/SURF4 family)
MQVTTKFNLLKQVSRLLLIILWVYAALTKLLDFEIARGQMINQIFPERSALVLAWLVPLTELITSVLLLIPRTVFYGLWISFCLLFIFTLYILLGLLDLYPRMPCSCGGVLSSLSWQAHLVFNLFFLVLTLIAIIHHYKGRSRLA